MDRERPWRMITRHPLTRTEIHAPATDWFPERAYFRCPRTGLEWLDPAPAPVFPDFSDYSRRLHQNDDTTASLDATPIFERAALAWARRQLPPGAAIVELFAETGRFARHLRNAGFRPLLADPLPNHVEVLAAHGYEAVCSTSVDELPSAWPQPAAVFILESIVRLPDPRAYLEAVRRRFPQAILFVTVPSPCRPIKLANINNRSGYPPDFLTRWTRHALREALVLSGYAADSRVITPGLITSVPPGRWKRRLFNACFNLFLWLNGELEFSYAAWGPPHTDT